MRLRLGQCLQREKDNERQERTSQHSTPTKIYGTTHEKREVSTNFAACWCARDETHSKRSHPKTLTGPVGRQATFFFQGRDTVLPLLYAALPVLLSHYNLLKVLMAHPFCCCCAAYSLAIRFTHSKTMHFSPCRIITRSPASRSRAHEIPPPPPPPG